MDYQRLRRVMRPVVSNLKDACTNTTMPELCEQLGLQVPPDLPSKRERMEWALDALPDQDLSQAAEKLLKYGLRDSAVRNTIQDILWSDSPCPELPKKHRKGVAHAMNSMQHYGSARHFDALLDGLWILDTVPFAHLFGAGNGLRGQVDQHVHRNPLDWGTDDLFEALGAYEASDHRFAKFIEGLASADVRDSEASQSQFVEVVNGALRSCGAELRPTGLKGGYPIFSLVSLHDGKRGSPKNLIFASPRKPDLRLRDAVDNDIEIVGNQAEVLVYDRPIGHEGLCWRDLQAWWTESKGFTDAEESKKTLYNRLRASLPTSSPPQRFLFESFHRGFSFAIPSLPALLPEVWLHWDYKTVQERGAAALLRYRMDFLMLLPGGVRLVIEVDGKQHYSDGNGFADVRRYAEMMKADRELKVAGYEVYRFGAVELQSDDSDQLVKEFFADLFKRYGVPVPVV